MSDAKMTVLKKGIELKLRRGEDLETVLAAYKSLSENDKEVLRKYLRKD